MASIFPDSPAVSDERPVVAVRDCPKPPPTRVSLGLPGDQRRGGGLAAGLRRRARRPAVAQALAGADPAELPAAGVRGRRATRWLLDRSRGRARRLTRIRDGGAGL